MIEESLECIQKINDFVYDLIRIQKRIRLNYECLNVYNYNDLYPVIESLIQEEKDALFLIKYAIMDLFNIEYHQFFTFLNFRLIPNYTNYKISCPKWGVDKSSEEYIILKFALNEVSGEFNDYLTLPNNAFFIKKKLGIKNEMI